MNTLGTDMSRRVWMERNNGLWRRLQRRSAALLLGAALGTVALSAHAQTPFGQPTELANALIEALASNDAPAVAGLLGPRWRQAIPLDDEGLRAELLVFLEKASQSRSVAVDGVRASLTVGRDAWTLPIPMVQGADARWRFDLAAARLEMAARRIGANERAAMQAVLAYVDAQRDYASADRNGDGVLEYAQRILSRPGLRDGLIWSARLGGNSPLGEHYLPSRADQGYHGYRFKVLTEQGARAPGGERNYRIGSRMTAGFALIAWPVAYGETGIMSFVVGPDGRVFERDLGPRTGAIAQSTRRFNPDDAWRLSPL